ncbi:hypothetical protein, partial [Spirosoma utsteinense]
LSARFIRFGSAKVVVLILIVKRKFKIFFESFATHSVLFILVGSAVADQEALFRSIWECKGRQKTGFVKGSG